jgi:Limiting CO2-inducible proteins B/C beta carbonyic anhydrases
VRCKQATLTKDPDELAQQFRKVPSSFSAYEAFRQLQKVDGATQIHSSISDEDNDDATNNPSAAAQYAGMNDMLEAEHAHVVRLLLPHARRLDMTQNVDTELPLALFAAQDEYLLQVIAKACKEAHGTLLPKGGGIVLLGGIHIVAPEGLQDHFFPMRFEIRDNNARMVHNLMTNITCSSSNTPPK